MPKDVGVTKDEVIEIIRSLEAKIYGIGTQIRWLGIALWCIRRHYWCWQLELCYSNPWYCNGNNRRIYSAFLWPEDGRLISYYQSIHRRYSQPVLLIQNLADSRG